MPKISGSGDQFILFRLDLKSGPPFQRTFLTQNLGWSFNRSLAKSGTFAAMKALVKKVKSEYPDVILELDGKVAPEPSK